MRVAERRAEREKIARMGAAVHESSLIFVGDVGVGKTHLLGVVQAESAIEAVVLRVNPAEALWPLSGFSAILSSINDSRAVEFGGRFVLRSTDPEHMFAAARDLLTLIRGLALSPMLLLVDDVDLMDRESQVLVGFIAGRLGGTGIRIVATARHIEPSGPFGGVPQEPLGPLGLSDALDLARRLAPSHADEGTLAIVVSQSGGNPRALIENLSELTAQQLQGEHSMLLPMVAGPTALAIGTHAVEQLGRAQRAMLERISAAPVSLRGVATAGGTGEEDALHDLIFAGLVDERGQYIAVHSALVRSHVYWSMPGRARREHHATASAAYSGVDDRIAVWHRSLGEGETAARAVTAAAVSFAHEGLVTAATEFAEHALRMPGGLPDLRTDLSDLAEALFLRGELALARRYLEVGLVASHAPATSGLAVLRLTIEFMRTQRLLDIDFDEWIAGRARQHPRSAAELVAVASLYAALRWEVDTARALLSGLDETLPALAQSADRFRDRTLDLIGAIDGAPPRLVDGPPLRRSAHRRVIDLIIAGRTATLREDYAGARRLLSIVLGQRPAPEPLWQDAARYLLADNEVRAGHFTSARAAIVDWASSRATRSSPAVYVYHDAWLAYASGNTAEADELITARLAEHPHEENPATAACLLAFKGELCLLDGDPDEAAHVLAQADLIGFRFHNPALVRHSADYVEAAVLSGHPAQAAAALAQFELRADEHPSRWSQLALARARAIVVDNDDLALAMFGEAIGSCLPTDSGLEVGRLHLAHAARLERVGMPTEARAALLTARSALDGAGAVPWLAYVDAALGTEVIMDGTMRLSEEELKVVHLVRQGLRNKEIATRLFVSVRTVELRLTHIYRKVGARSRSHLASLTL